LGGDEIVLFDNLSGSVGCDVLDRALTGTVWKERILGMSKVFDGPLLTTFLGTANNAWLAHDTPRRVQMIRLHTLLEHPEERTDFQIPNILEHVREHRGAILSAALTMLRAYYVAGRPDQKLPTWGSYEAWSGIVRAAVVFAGLPDPIGAREDLRTCNPEREALGQLLQGLAAMDIVYGRNGAGFTVAEILSKNNDTVPDPKVRGIKDALQVLCHQAFRGKDIDRRAIGMALHHKQGQVVDCMFLERIGEARAGARWRAGLAGLAGAPSAKSEQEEKDSHNSCTGDGSEDDNELNMGQNTAASAASPAGATATDGINPGQDTPASPASAAAGEDSPFVREFLKAFPNGMPKDWYLKN
jgi:hypothetical protein